MKIFMAIWWVACMVLGIWMCVRHIKVDLACWHRGGSPITTELWFPPTCLKNGAVIK